MNTIKQGTNKFYIGEDDEDIIAEITFYPRGDDTIVVDHTYVSRSLKGQGVGGRLVDKVVEYALKENKKVLPSCSFARKVMSENEEYRKCICD